MRWSANILLIALAWILITLCAHAEDLSANDNVAQSGYMEFLQNQNVSGSLRTDYFESSKSLDDKTGLFGVVGQIKVLPSFTGNLDGKIEARFRKPFSSDGGVTQNGLIEGYVTAHFDKADVRIGKQVVAWGRADGINPTDNLTPRDFTVLLPFEDDRRFGTTAIKLDAFLSQENTISVFVTPYFEHSIIPLSVTGSTFVETMPRHTLANTEFGVKLDKVGDGLDWSVSTFRGFSLLPDMRYAGSTAAGSMLELHYDRITVFGGDFARNFGRFGFRGEIAYVNTTDALGTDAGVKNPYLYWVAGVDRTLFESLNVNLQYFQRRVRNYHDPGSIADPLERSIAIQNSVLDGQRDRINNGISFRVSNKWINDTFEGEIFSVINLTRKDRFVRPLLTYAFSDQWRGSIGGEFYSGDDDTQYGGLKRNSGVFAELRYVF